MSVLSWLRRRKSPPPDEPPRSPLQPPAKPLDPDPDDPLAAMARYGAADGPSEAQMLALLQTAAQSARASEAITTIASLTTRQRLPDSIRTACAQILGERGEQAGALRLLEGVAQPAALMLRADLLQDSGDTAQALSLIERLLARDIDFPGGRERLERWRRQLGSSPGRPRARADETIAAPPPSQAPLRVVREVARGGSGTIYEARDELLGRTVAFKVYHRIEADRDQALREARLASQLSGPGVVRVLDADFDHGWLALEWVALGSIRDRLAAGDTTQLAKLDRWAVALASALARVHRAGLVHADVKPANILLRSADEPLLSDFGICVQQGSASLGGSAGYLSPERLAGKPLTYSDDVYAFGRVVDDALARLPRLRNHAGWRTVADRCMQPCPLRPCSGETLLALIRQAAGVDC
jgi:eukaryotic-like serine/threonine-protein kinase